MFTPAIRRLQSVSSAPRPVRMKARQIPLCQHYQRVPEDARIVDSATTSCTDVDANNPLQSAVRFCQKNPINMRVGVHTAVGGDGDYPTPGDILCGAIAACLDSTVRIISNRLGVSLKQLSVEVKGTVDVRGTLRVDHTTPVAFQKFEVTVLLKPTRWLPGKVLDKILNAAEYSCVVIQTVKQGAEVSVSRRS